MFSKSIIKNTLCLATGIILLTSSAAYAKNNELNTDARKASYTMGRKMGRYIHANSFNGFNIESLFAGIRDGIEGNKPRISAAQMDKSMDAVKKLQAKEKREIAKKNHEQGKRFMAENRKVSGVVQTGSGLQYKIITPGNGASPKATDVVKTHYRGTLTDGSEFDSSYGRNSPASFPVNRVIKGWTEALQLMKVGSKWRLFIPSELAYGSRSPSQAIPANSTLIFDIELFEIEDQNATKNGKKKGQSPTNKSKKNDKKESNESNESNIKTNRM